MVERRAIIADCAGGGVNRETVRSAISQAVGDRVALGVGRSDHADIAHCHILVDRQVADRVEHSVAFLYVIDIDGDIHGNVGRHVAGADRRGDHFQIDRGVRLVVEPVAHVADGAGRGIDGETHLRGIAAEAVGHCLALGVGRGNRSDRAGSGVLIDRQVADRVEHGVAFLDVADIDGNHHFNAGRHAVGAGGCGDNGQVNRRGGFVVESVAHITDGAGRGIDGEAGRSVFQAIADRIRIIRVVVGVGCSDHADIAGSGVFHNGQCADGVEYGVCRRTFDVADRHGDRGRVAGDIGQHVGGGIFVTPVKGVILGHRDPVGEQGSYAAEVTVGRMGVALFVNLEHGVNRGQREFAAGHAAVEQAGDFNLGQIEQGIGNCFAAHEVSEEGFREFRIGQVRRIRRLEGVGSGNVVRQFGQRHPVIHAIDPIIEPRSSGRRTEHGHRQSDNAGSGFSSNCHFVTP